MTETQAHLVRRSLSMGLAAAALLLAIPARSHADEGDTERFPRLSRLFDRTTKDADADGEESSPPRSITIPWWSVPKSARAAAKTLAANQDATLTRCVAIDQGDVISYEIHASKQTGLFKRSHFVLTTVAEPKTTVEERRKEKSLKGRWERFRKNGFRGENSNARTSVYADKYGL